LSYVGKRPDHPALEVQRIKERLGLRDVHLSISERSLERLLDALHDAVEAGSDHAPYIAGEILSAALHSALMAGRSEQIVAAVHRILKDADLALSSVTAFAVDRSNPNILSP
jgi:hypothetical protein